MYMHTLQCACGGQRSACGAAPHCWFETEFLIGLELMHEVRFVDQ